MSSERQTFFWVVNGLGLQASLIYCPGQTLEATEVLSLVFRDCDGELINRAQIEFPIERNCLVDLSHFLELMKSESGLSHGLVQITSGSEGRTIVRYQHHQMASFQQPGDYISNNSPGLVALYFAPGRKTMIALANTEDSSVEVRARLVAGKRSPEVQWTLGANSSRLIDISHECAASLGEESNIFAGRGYLRISTTSTKGIIVQSLMIEIGENHEESISVQ